VTQRRVHADEYKPGARRQWLRSDVALAGDCAALPAARIPVRPRGARLALRTL